MKLKAIQLCTSQHEEHKQKIMKKQKEQERVDESKESFSLSSISQLEVEADALPQFKVPVKSLA
jgi:hypothetical protein